MSLFQFCLSKSDKEQYEREERQEIQQEILKRAAKDLPIYTTTATKGAFFLLLLCGDEAAGGGRENHNGS